MLQPNQSQFSSENVPAEAWGPIYYGWVIVAACFVVIALVSPLISSFSIFQVAILGEFNWSRGDLAIALAIHLALGGLASPLAGDLIDRFGPRRVMPAGALITATALILISQSGSVWHFYIAYGVVAAAGSSLLQIAPLTALISDWFARHRGVAVGIVSAGSGAGQLALLPLIRYLIHRIGWRYAYLALGALILIIPTVLTRLFLYARPQNSGPPAAIEGVEEPEDERKTMSRPQREASTLGQEWAETDWTLSKASRTFRFWALALVMALFAAGFFLISVQLPAYLEEKGYGPILAASVVGLQGMLNMVGKLLGGTLCDRMGREKTLTLSAILFVICLLLLNIAGVVVSPALAYAFTIFYGISFGMATPALITSASDLFQGKRRGSILGAIVLGGYVGGAVGAWLSGRFFDLTGAYEINFLAAGLAMLTSAWLIWKANPDAVRHAQHRLS